MIARRPVSLSWQNATCSWLSGEKGSACGDIGDIQDRDVEADDDETDTMAAPWVEPLRGRRALFSLCRAARRASAALTMWHSPK